MLAVLALNIHILFVVYVVERNIKLFPLLCHCTFNSHATHFRQWLHFSKGENEWDSIFVQIYFTIGKKRRNSVEKKSVSIRAKSNSALVFFDWNKAVSSYQPLKRSSVNEKSNTFKARKLNIEPTQKDYSCVCSLCEVFSTAQSIALNYFFPFASLNAFCAVVVAVVYAITSVKQTSSILHFFRDGIHLQVDTFTIWMWIRIRLL